MLLESCDNMQIDIESVPKSLTGSDVSLSIKLVESYTDDVLSHCVNLHYQYQHGCHQLVFTTVNDSRSACIVLFQYFSICSSPCAAFYIHCITLPSYSY